MILHIDLHTYSYAYTSEIYEVLHYYKLSAKTDSGDYMPLRAHYGYQDLSLSTNDQILCQLINLNYTYSILLDLLKSEKYDDIEVSIMWGGKPKRARAVVDSTFINYKDNEKKQAILYKVRQQTKVLNNYLPIEKIHEQNARDLLGNRNVKRDGYKYNRAVGMTINKLPNGHKFTTDIINDYNLKELFAKEHIRITDHTRKERAKRRRERLRGGNGGALSTIVSTTTKNDTNTSKPVDKKLVNKKREIIDFANTIIKQETMQKGTYNYLDDCKGEEKVWVKSCYRYLLCTLMSDTGEVKLVSTEGVDLSTPAAIKRELSKLENEDKISIDLENSFLELVDEFTDDGEDNKISFKCYIDDYDGYDLYI